MSTEVDDFLAHYGKKGMKWGRRQDSGSTSTGPPRGTRQNGSPEPKRISPSTKRKIALGAGLVASVGLVALNSSANSKKQAQGQQFAQAYMNQYASRSKWDLAANLPPKR